MSRKTKPRKSETRAYDPDAELPYKVLDAIPKAYIVVPESIASDSKVLQGRIEYWDERMRKRGMRIKKPISIYRFAHTVTFVDLCVEVEKDS